MDEKKDQNMDYSFSRQRKPEYGGGIVRLANRVAVWHQGKDLSIFGKFLGLTNQMPRSFVSVR